MSTTGAPAEVTDALIAGASQGLMASDGPRLKELLTLPSHTDSSVGLWYGRGRLKQSVQ